MKIENEVLAVLDRCRTEADRLYLPQEQLARKLYVRVDQVLQLSGGHWNRRSRAHVFELDAGEALEQLLMTGEVENAKKDFDAFYTPAWLAAKVVDLASLRLGSRVLEPSAGDGAIAEVVQRRGYLLYAIDIRQEQVDQMRSLGGLQAECADFLSIDANARFGEFLFDAVVMNPPFSKRQDVRHVAHALTFLRPGGRLVAIMSAGILYRADTLTAWLREEVYRNGGSIEQLEPGAFKESGTMVNACLVSMTRP